MDELEGRSVRRLRLAVAAGGVAIVALGGVHVIASQPPDELVIGHVTIHQHGIAITSPVGSERVFLQAGHVQVWSDERGGVLNRSARHVVRMQTWEDGPDGAALLEVSSNEAVDHTTERRTDFRVLSTSDLAIARTTAGGVEHELRAELDVSSGSVRGRPRR